MALSRFSVWTLAVALVVTMAVSTVACTSDKDPDGPDGGMDAGREPNDGPDAERPRFEAGGPFIDPVPPCDPFQPDECAAGQECDVVLRRNPTAETFDIYTGCVDIQNERGLGDPCVPWNSFGTPYEVPDLFDEVHTDPCEQGLLCAPDPDVRGLSSCQPSCQSGRYDGFPRYSCDRVSDFCAAVSPSNPDPYREYCVPTDGCNPADPDSCGRGQSCYLRPTATGDGVLSLCLSVPDETIVIADGEGCGAVNACGKGSVCWGPVRVPPASWTSEDVECRPVCDPMADDDGDDDPVDDDDDAGVDTDDGGVPDGNSGGCPGTSECVAFEESGLSLGTVDGIFGQCE